MISEAEIRRSAAAANVDPMVIDLDYSLGWFLLGMLKTGSRFGNLVFKGGTCLRKCYFPDYRFSEDLDFTATKYLSPAEMEQWITTSVDWISSQGGPDFNIQPVHFEVVDDEYGSESYQARIYYRGPLRWGGSPRTVKLDITRAETIFLPIKEKSIIHPYSDQVNFIGSTIPCYCLEEVIAEKIRAVGGQRRFAVSRDLYDIYNLVAYGINLEAVKQILPEKFRVRGLNLQGVDVKTMVQRRSEFENDWERRLNYLVINKGLQFETAWLCVLDVLGKVLQNA
ncbi:MAG TPA: nucleotidyl transferase AbiEii/AbiGii toxin family protein [Anaerolineaceae bacterium]|jgi:predicted nucleotidyltransferase component of viral defense system|nr:nucleotidyl transferase AbiEii/AbiGii toxin family protein [Anaerolineaceae bacterium]HQF64132.1 nucleotidyl transferase AbiEii/AbiGii toxin family protein [Anaerolineaceae bacterium]HQN44940.1 nucleotidyl transferase AbiEii/AbiGii toxin family protein [Anaerolineaceae bacterium]